MTSWLSRQLEAEYKSKLVFNDKENMRQYFKEFGGNNQDKKAKKTACQKKSCNNR